MFPLAELPVLWLCYPSSFLVWNYSVMGFSRGQIRNETYGSIILYSSSYLIDEQVEKWSTAQYAPFPLYL